MALLPHVRDRRVSYKNLGGKVSFNSWRRFSLARPRRTVFLLLMIPPEEEPPRAPAPTLAEFVPTTASMNRPLLVSVMRRRRRAPAEA
jgi:hypothetical protein